MACALVFGATGYIGSHLVPRLLADGWTVRVSSRRREVLEGRGWSGVEIVEADALERETLAPALAGVDVAYYLVHSMSGGAGFAERDRLAAQHFREAAAAAGVRRIVYLGGLQADAGDGDEAASEHLASRRETGDELRAGPVPVTELRAGVIVGPGSIAFEVIRDLVYHLPVMITPRWVRSRMQPIALDDVLTYLVRVAAIEGAAGRIFDVGGPEPLSYEQMLRQAAEVLGRSLRIVPVPVLSPRLSSYWLDLVTTVPARVARPLVDGLRHDLLADDAAIRALIPLSLMTYREAVSAALKLERSEEPPGRWTEGAFIYRRSRHDVSFYSKSARASAVVAAPAEATWAQVIAIGGANGWYWNTWLWRLRALLDRLVGGAGMRRGRRSPDSARVGDAIDFWRVTAVEPGQRLTLLAEMRLPGAAVLEFAVSDEGEGRSRIETVAHFAPAGLMGLLYWYALAPVHAAIFGGMARRIAQRAERAAPTAPVAR